MVSIRTKYFIRKFLWGLAFILMGICLGFTSESEIFDIIVIVIITVIAILFLGIFIGNIYIWRKKVEPEDELSIQNDLRAQTVVLQLITILILIYAVIGQPFHFEITKYIAYIVYGVLQILEYFAFLFFVECKIGLMK